MVSASFKKLRKISGDAIVRYRMISDGDRILAGLSGGKDSFVLLELLHQLQKVAPVSFEIAAVTFDPGFPEYNVKETALYCQRKGWEHHVIAMKIADIIDEKDFSHAPCVMCSRLRRGRLYRAARELNCSKLALGHHLDDVIISFLMSLCRGQGLATMAPVVKPQEKGNPVVIRPLVLAPESLIRQCAGEMELPAAGICRYREQLDSGDRKFFGSTIARWEERIPDLRSNIANSLRNPKTAHLLCEPEKL